MLDSMPISARPGAKKALQDICNAEDPDHVGHWIHLRTTNPIESAFATVRLRTKLRGAGSRTAGLAVLFEPVESAQQRWQAMNALHLVALVRAGARFAGCRLVVCPSVVAA